MKKTLLLLIFFYIEIGNSQTLQEVTLTQIENGVNLKLNVYGSTVIGYLSHGYTIENNVIEVNVCYWYTGFFAITNLENNFAIPLPEEMANYTMNIKIHNSYSMQNCDYNEMTDSLSFDFSTPLEEPIVLSTEQFQWSQYDIQIYPNPTNGIVNLDASFYIESVAIYDAFGRLVHHQNEVIEKQLNISHLAKGMYFIKVNNQAHFVKKIWVQ
jgi:hypothetical protein